MVRSFYAMRHGIAEDPETWTGPDRDRPLTRKGRSRTAELGHALKSLRIAPDVIATSPYSRAIETAKIVAKQLGLAERLRVEEALAADKTAAEQEDWLKSGPGEVVLAVGHNPSITELVARLSAADGQPARIAELRKGGIAAFVGVEDGSFRLEWIVPPRLLRRVR